MKSKKLTAVSPSHIVLLACVALACCQMGMANPEKPGEDRRLAAFYVSIHPWMKLPTATDWYPEGLPLPDNITEYPDQQEDLRYYSFKEIRLQANILFGNGQLTAMKAGELLETSLQLLHSDYPNYRIYYWVLFADLASCMTSANGLLQMRRHDILKTARNLKMVVDAMDRTIIPDFKGYPPRPSRHGFIGSKPGEKVYSYNGLLTTKREDIYNFMRQENIVGTQEFMNMEQANLQRYRAMIASTIHAMIAIANDMKELR